ncbi:hypothetical protein [Mycobacterium sp.]|uniref:hypothetical protein n=1 Tax=Mycobacterium sp. TaxID=1785 RepID=UPI0012702B20|nr:hypothetical protein [Mycobacterium sp.]KAA8961610.1 MAG: hypothetical protein F6Q13_12740 [Mycobacterium sp.]
MIFRVRRHTAVLQHQAGLAAALVTLGGAVGLLAGAPAHADAVALDAAASAATSAITIDDLLGQQLGILANTFADTLYFDYAVLLGLLGIPTGAGDSTDPAVLLGNATAILTDADTVINTIPADIPSKLPGFLATGYPSDQVGQQQILIDDVTSLSAAENTIAAHLGSLSSVVDNLYFDPVDDVIVSHSEALLHADQTLATTLMSTPPDTVAIFGAENTVDSINNVFNLSAVLTGPIIEWANFVSAF